MKSLRVPIIVLLGLLLLMPAAPAAGGAGVTAPAAPLQSPGAWTGDPVVRTRYGEVQGYGDRDETWVWRAIPYARPPVGELRWRAPRDPLPWRGVRRMRSFHRGCTQYGLLGGIMGGEDCLYLNIWRPRDAGDGLPVYVWIHGGGNSTGSATMVPDYYGHRVAARSRMVFVSLNYRLGPFGWFTHPALRAGEPPDDASGNYGTLDIIKALAWIRENIAAFGGDPARVAIAGESAGGFNVLSMLISPRAAGLFQRAICQSGLPASKRIDEADARSREVLAKLLLDDGRAGTRSEAQTLAAAMAPEEIRSYLRSKSDRAILRCYTPGVAGMIDNPAILRDGFVIPREGFDAFTDGACANKVPLLIGSNREELKIFLYFTRCLSWKSDLYQALAKYGSALWKAAGVDGVARKLSAAPGQSPVYAYEFAWGTPDAAGQSPLPGNWGRKLGAFHGLEISFFLGTDTIFGLLQHFLLTGRNRPGRAALSEAMMSYAANFAKNGDPNGTGGGSFPVWEPWSNAPGGPKCIVLDAAGDTYDIAMSRLEYTEEGVLAAVRAELAEPLRGRVLEMLQKGLF